jgi:hypothetical protein
MKASLLALAAIVVWSGRALAAVGIYSGALTTVLEERDEPSSSSPNGLVAFSRATEKHYLIFDDSGKYYFLRLYKDGADKKVAIAAQGTLKPMDLPGDAKHKTHQSVLHETVVGAAPYPGTDGPETRTFLTGLSSMAVAEAVGLPGGLLPASYNFSRTIVTDYSFSPIVLAADQHSFSNQTGRLKLERPLTKAANLAGDNLEAAKDRALVAIHAQGYAGP